DIQQSLQVLLSQNSNAEESEQAYQLVHERLDAFVNETQRFQEITLLNSRRKVILSTDRQREGYLGTTATLAYFQMGLENEYLHPPSFNLATMTGQNVGIVIVRPVRDDAGKVLGIVTGWTSPDRLSEIMLERSGLGTTGETFLVASNYVMLTEPRFPLVGVHDANYVFSDAAKFALEHHLNGSGVYANHRGVKVVGVYRWLPELQVALIAEQAENEAMAVVYKTLGVNIGVVVLSILLTIGVSALLARSISLPLIDLARTAARVSDGELDIEVPVIREDEIGALARSFNSMTARLKELIGGLEQRVAERTRSLQYRALQLETSTQVSREITSILEIDQLLNRVVTLIAGAFGYYHVSIFLVEKDTNQLVYRSGGGEIKFSEYARNWLIVLGEGSLNGEAVEKNEMIIVNDVVNDPRYLPNEYLPETQSELVAPLRFGSQVIGTLDVQSKKKDAFGEDDARILQGLGDQIAIAIENACLYTKSRTLAAVEERNRLARELHDSVTQSLYGLVSLAVAGSDLMSAGDIKPVQQYLGWMETAAQQALNEMRLLLYELRPPGLEMEGLAGALKQRLVAVEERVGLKTSFKIDETIQLSEAVAENLYRLAIEALNNTLKHSAASTIKIELVRQGERVQLIIVDDGDGFDVDSALAGGGLGLAGMQERAAEIGGLLTLKSVPGQGSIIQLAFEESDDES
ncbi:MAG: GAF domain-containing protein, partial [Anaerolineales bacterium]|nr:GAF domain-containing protein [Anaerolineales bacterium]